MKEVIKSLGRAWFRAQGYFPAQVDGQPYRMDPYHFAFWRAYSKGYWEPETLKVISRFTSPETSYVDVGAWIGPTVLHGATQAKHVYCFEPDPTALRYLNWNLDQNNVRNVSRFGLALAAEPGVFQISTFGEEPGDSKSSLLESASDYATDVWAITWDEFLQRSNPQDVSLIKIDVEGAEFDLVPTMRSYLQEKRPALLLSTHAPYLNGGRQEAMTKLAQALDFYPHVYSEDLQPMSKDQLMSQAACDGFGSYLFTDERL
jgi:FkbM family methyltransferase